MCSRMGTLSKNINQLVLTTETLDGVDTPLTVPLPPPDEEPPLHPENIKMNIAMLKLDAVTFEIDVMGFMIRSLITGWLEGG